jgi:hypothetical protein
MDTFQTVSGCARSDPLAWRPGFDLTGDFCTSGSEREFTPEERWRATKGYKPEQIVTLLRQIGVETANGTELSALL